MWKSGAAMRSFLGSELLASVMNERKHFECWTSESEGSRSFFESCNTAARAILAADAQLVWEVDAANWVQAMTLMHEHFGLEPYVPPDDADDLDLTSAS
jgi:hypothetical protein